MATTKLILLGWLGELIFLSLHNLVLLTPGAACQPAAVTEHGARAPWHPGCGSFPTELRSCHTHDLVSDLWLPFRGRQMAEKRSSGVSWPDFSPVYHEANHGFKIHSRSSRQLQSLTGTLLGWEKSEHYRIEQGLRIKWSIFIFWNMGREGGRLGLFVAGIKPRRQPRRGRSRKTVKMALGWDKAAPSHHRETKRGPCHRLPPHPGPASAFYMRPWPFHQWGDFFFFSS